MEIFIPRYLYLAAPEIIITKDEVLAVVEAYLEGCIVTVEVANKAA